MKKTILASSLALLFSQAVIAAGDTHADQLVGKIYGGFHGMYLNADNDRITANGQTTADHGQGFGGEIGTRISPTTEFRFSYTDLNISNSLDGFAEPSGSAAALDVLYFFDQKNVYLVAGLDRLEVEEKRVSADLGLGYRHYFNQRFALYLEGKGHYQLKDDFTDFSTKLGFIYYFGDFKKSLPKKQTTSQPVTTSNVTVVSAAALSPAVAKPIDSDNDGVIDSLDKCANTPATDKVDNNGCTVFTDKTDSLTLLINFDNNKAEIKPGFSDELAKAAEFLSTYPHINMIIEGHSSSQGAAAYNKLLSQKRADAIVAALVERFDIDAERLTAIGYGEERLLDSANTAEAHSKNRRIEALVQVKEKVAVKR